MLRNTGWDVRDNTLDLLFLLLKLSWQINSLECFHSLLLENDAEIVQISGMTSSCDPNRLQLGGTLLSCRNTKTAYEIQNG